MESASRSFTDIRVFGPIMMIVFGLALLFTPLASVSSFGSVGNAGTVGKPTTTIGPTPTTIGPTPTTITEPSTPTTAADTAGDDLGRANVVPPAPAGSEVLPRTGPNDRSLVLILVGVAFVAAGCGLLVMGRRTTDP